MPHEISRQFTWQSRDQLIAAFENREFVRQEFNLPAIVLRHPSKGFLTEEQQQELIENITMWPREVASFFRNSDQVHMKTQYDLQDRDGDPWVCISQWHLSDEEVLESQQQSAVVRLSLQARAQSNRESHLKARKIAYEFLSQCRPEDRTSHIHAYFH